MKMFIKQNTFNRFSIPETITVNQETVLTGKEVRRGIKMIHLTSYYPQANGQAEASKKIVVNLIWKNIEENPREWNSTLSTILWAYRTS